MKPATSICARLRRGLLARGLIVGIVAGCVASAAPGTAMGATPTPVIVSECSSATGLRGAIEQNTDVAVTFSCSGTIPISSPLVVAAGHTVSINGSGQSVVLDGGEASRILTVEGGDLIISHLTLQKGRASGAPGIGATQSAPYPWPTAQAGESSTNPAVAGTNGADGANGQPGGEGGAGQGGALYIASASTVEVDEVTFSKDLATGGAGGLGWYGEDGGKAGAGADGTEAHPDGSSGGNSGSGGEGGPGGAGGPGQGGAIYNAGALSVLNSSFTEDEAVGGTGGRGGYGGEPGAMPANSEKPAPNGGDGFSFTLNGQLDPTGGSGGFGGDSGNQGNGGNGGGGGTGEGGAIYNGGGLSVSNSSFSTDAATGASGGGGQAPFTGGVIRGGDGGEGGKSLPLHYEEDAKGGGGGEGGQAGNGGNGGNGGAGGAGGSGVGAAIASDASLTASTNTYGGDAVNAGSGGNGGNPGEAGCGGWGGIGGTTNAVLYDEEHNEYLQLEVYGYTANYFHEPAGYDCVETTPKYQPAGGAGGVPGSETPEGEPGSDPHAVIEPNFPAQPGKAKTEPGFEPPYSICDPRDGQRDCLPGTTGADGHAGIDGLGGHGGAAGSVASPVDVIDDLGSAPAIQTTTLPGGQVGTPYETTLAASGGTPTYTWKVTSGALPAGLVLRSDGVIAGTPTTVETASFTVSLSDASKPVQTATRSLSLSVIASGAETKKEEAPATKKSEQPAVAKAGVPVVKEATPNAVLASTSLRAGAQGALSVKVSCPAAVSSCTGTITLKTLTAVSALSAHQSKKRKAVVLTLAVGSFKVAGGHASTVKLHLSAKARALLARSHVLRARATIVSHDPAGATHTTQAIVTIRPAKATAGHKG